MATQDDVRRIALSLPQTSEAADHFGFGVLNKDKVKGFAWTWNERIEPKKPRVPNPEVLAVRVAPPRGEFAERPRRHQREEAVVARVREGRAVGGVVHQPPDPVEEQGAGEEQRRAPPPRRAGGPREERGEAGEVRDVARHRAPGGVGEAAGGDERLAQRAEICRRRPRRAVRGHRRAPRRGT